MLRCTSIKRISTADDKRNQERARQHFPMFCRGLPRSPGNEYNRLSFDVKARLCTHDALNCLVNVELQNLYDAVK